MGPSWRNILIVVLIAAAVYAIPGGGTAADIVSQLVSIAFAVSIWFALVYVYRNFRTTIFTLGDQGRLFLYGGLAALLFLGAAADRFFDSGALTFLWLAVLVAAVYALFMAFQRYRSYD